MIKKKTWVRIVVVLFIGLIIIQVNRGCAFKAEKARAKQNELLLEQAAIPVNVVEVKRSNIDEVISLTGDVRGRAEVDVYAKVTGKLIKKVMEEEAYVDKDAVVALVDRDEAAMEYANAEVLAPISGILTRYYVDMGGAVAPQIPLLNIADIGQIKVVVNIVEKDIPKIRNGQAAKITVDSYPDVSFYGKVATINQALDRMTRTVAVQIVVDNEKHLLKPGMFAKVKLYVLSKRNVMVVPVESVMETAGGGSYVVVVEGDKAVKKPVEAGISDEAKTEIKSGLKDRDLVVIAGQSKLSENSEVKIIQ